VIEAAEAVLFRNRGELPLARVPEGRVAEVVHERDRLGEVLVGAQVARDRARDLRDLDRVREAGPVEVALVDDEDLCLVLETPERFRVDDAVAIALVLGALSVLRLSMPPAATPGDVRSEGRERPLLDGFERTSVAGRHFPWLVSSLRFYHEALTHGVFQERKVISGSSSRRRRRERPATDGHSRDELTVPR
jgi:hypothetical protein